MYKKIFIHLFAVFQSGIFINANREFNSQVGDIQFYILVFHSKKVKCLTEKLKSK